MQIIINTGLVEESWDESLLAHPGSNFLQSWSWGEFQKSIGNSIWRIAVEQDSKLILQLLVIKLSIGFGQTILYSPRGQIVSKHSSAQQLNQAGNLAIKAIRDIAKSTNSILFRIDPPTTLEDRATASVYKEFGFIANSKKHIQPEHVQLVDLSPGLSTVLANAKPKTRYNVGIAKKYLLEGQLILSESTNDSAIDNFLSLTFSTASRQGIAPHSSKYYKAQIKTLADANMGTLLQVSTNIESPVQCLGSVWIGFFGDTATYIHGASSSEHRNLMAPYLLHYHAMQKAVEKGMRYYDLGGIHPNPNHPWAGITRFKSGFGGKEISYIGSLELPLNHFLYSIYRLLTSIR